MNRSESLADAHLLRLVRARDQDGWAQFVERYQGRMVAFAKGQVGQTSDAEDLVQDTFIGFLRTLDEYREQSKLESWLFRILRRRIIDHFRSQGTNREIPACSFAGGTSVESIGDPIASLVDPSLSPSVHAGQAEQRGGDERALSAALHGVIDRMKRETNLRDLMIMEGVFYARIRNRSLSKLIDVDEGQVALVRHRLLKRIRALVAQRDDSTAAGEDVSLASSDLLTRIWERDRPSCLKRTTLGKSLIGILDDSWQQYVTFHVDTLGCTYCRANRDDLDQQGDDEIHSQRSQRLFQSTIGFIRSP